MGGSNPSPQYSITPLLNRRCERWSSRQVTLLRLPVIGRAVSAAGLAPAVTRAQAGHVAPTPRAEEGPAPSGNGAGTEGAGH